MTGAPRSDRAADAPVAPEPAPPGSPPARVRPSDRPAAVAPPGPAASPAAPPAPEPARRRRFGHPHPRTARPIRPSERRCGLIERARRPLTGAHQVAVVSLKGGLGRTTTTALLGLTLAAHRTDAIIAVDASPAGGTLADRLVGGAATGIRELLDRLEEIDTRDDIERFTGVAGRLRVLASDQDLVRNLALNGLEYERVCLLLRRHYPVILTDGSTGPALAATLAMAHSVVVVGSRTVDGAGRADRTLDYLIAHGHRDEAARAVLVLDGDRASAEVDASRLWAHFAARCRAVLEFPPDPQLAHGGRIDPAALAPATRDAALELAALVADEFGRVPAGRC